MYSVNTSMIWKENKHVFGHIHFVETVKDYDKASEGQFTCKGTAKMLLETKHLVRYLSFIKSQVRGGGGLGNFP